MNYFKILLTFLLSSSKMESNCYVCFLLQLATEKKIKLYKKKGSFFFRKVDLAEKKKEPNTNTNTIHKFRAPLGLQFPQNIKPVFLN